MSTLMTSMMPKMILGLVDKFKQYVKANQPFEDLAMDFSG